MKKLTHIFSFIFTLLFALNITVAAAPSDKQVYAPPIATDGIIDLQSIDWQNTSVVKLDGEWEFYYQNLLTPQDFTETAAYPRHLVKVPGPWNNYTLEGEPVEGSGYGTYRLIIHTPDASRQLALKFPFPYTAHKLWANGQLISEAGVVTTNVATSEGRFYDKILPIKTAGNRIELVMQVSNFMHDKGGPRRSITFGDQNVLEREFFRSTSINLFTFGFMVALGLTYSFFFLIRHFEKTAAFFAAFVLTFSLRELTTGNSIIVYLLPSLPQTLILRSEYMTMFALVFYAWFVHALLPGKIPDRLIKAITLTSIIQLVLIAFAPVSFFTRILPINQLFLTALLIYLLAVIAKASWQKNHDARLLLIGHLSLVAAIIHDEIYYTDLIQTGDLYSLGVIILTGIQSILVLRRFITAFGVIEVLNQKLTEMNKLKDDFLAEVTHEILTPIHGINGFLDSIKDSAAARLSAPERKSLDTVMAINRRLVNLVTDIQDFLKLKHRDIILHPENIQLKDTVELVIATCRILAGQKNLTFINAVDPSIIVYSDQTKLQQILHNLIENAVKYTPAGEIHISSTLSGNQVTIHIADTGRGIPEDQLSAIFSPYIQIEGETDGQYKGSGLGLSISKTLVELQGGTIWVKSQENDGSVFSFTLPAGSRQAAREAAQQHTPLENTDNHLRTTDTQAAILIVDDEPVNLSILENYLGQQPYQITKAINGRSALEEIAKMDYDLVLLDLMLPDLSGYEVCQHIRKRFTPLELPVLILTVRNKPDDIVLALEIGANDYLAKPFNKRELLARVSSLLLMKKSLKLAVKSERDLLLSQIKPHFFYNVLNTIMGFCITDPRKAYDLLGEFSLFISNRLHYCSIKHFIELGEELTTIRSYLKIETARFGDLLRYEIYCNAPLTYPISPLLIEPLVENAVKHGIREKRNGGCVTVNIETVEEGVQITVTDDGAGMTPERLEDIQNSRLGAVGIGLANVRRRLELDYNQPLHITSSPDAGTTVWFLLPNETTIAKKP
ncbi:Sensor histidine kinase RcsC [bioreactor metagenome]|uniref:histidine kinase n=1 Tax=bioreactor metagenome TaxID=1076179 RepID=A0A644TH22_9ZZZZ